MTKNTKAQTGGLITGLVFGIASLVIGVIIAFVIVSTLSDADLLSTGRNSVSIVNETGYINGTGYNLTAFEVYRFVPGSISISIAYNGSTVIDSGNWTLETTGNLINTSAVTQNITNFTYTYTLYTSEEISSSDLSDNFSAGVDNVSARIPTVLLVAAVVLILGVLALLVGVWQKMRIGGGSI